MPLEDDLFVNDDLDNSAENRLNHILFGLFLKDEYRREVLRRLGVAQDAIIYKPSNRSWGRPDFAVESRHGDTLGYIEVELDKDLGQLAHYQANAEASVYSFGREKRDHNITLQELVGIGECIVENAPAPQFELMVRHFAKQVSEAAGSRKALLKVGMVNWGEELIRPGKLYGRTNGPEGISVRVFAPKRKGSDKTVGLLNITAGRPVVRFAIHSHLAEYLHDNKRTALDEWADFIEQRLDGDIRIIGRRHCPIDLSVVEDNVDDMLEAMLPLC